MPQESSTASKVLLEFLTALGKWEAETFQLSKNTKWASHDEHRQWVTERKHELAQIFIKYCDKGVKAERLRDIGLSYQGRDSDKPLTEEIVSVTEAGNIATIITRETLGPQWFSKYEVVRVPQGWIVSDKKLQTLRQDGEWFRGML